MKKNIFKEYVEIRKELNIHKPLYYLKKVLLPLSFTIIIFYLYSTFFIKINHKDIATVLVSTNSIVAAFLVLSLTILLTQNIQDKVPNKDFSYKKLLINNAEVSVVLVLSSILINLFYMLISSPSFTNTDTTFIKVYNYSLSGISFLSIFATVLVIKIAIDDLLLISSKTKETH